MSTKEDKGVHASYGVSKLIAKADEPYNIIE